MEDARDASPLCTLEDDDAAGPAGAADDTFDALEEAAAGAGLLAV